MDLKQQRPCVYDPLAAFMEHYATARPSVHAPEDQVALSVEEKLRRRIIDGDGIGLQGDLDEARTLHEPLEIINRILLDGMKTVGELFGSGQMQLPFVLQSAETMKSAVAYLEQFMDRLEGVEKGTIVLATVKGDVHDIGKNLVDIILTNNGYKVVNLGIKVPVDTMLAAAEEHRADVIGMSGLLVKSTVIMKENLELMRHRGLRIPVVLGGAALTRRYVEEDLRAVYDGDLAYANDAFDGLTFMERTVAHREASSSQASGTGSPVAPASLDPGSSSRTPRRAPREGRGAAAPGGPRSAVSEDVPIPRAPFYGSRVVLDVRLENVYDYINETALFRGQWQVRRGAMSEHEYDEMIERDIRPVYERIKLQAKRDRVLQPAVVYGYFPCMSDGETLIVYRPSELEERALQSEWPRTDYTAEELVPWQEFHFPRQAGERRLCIADFFRPVASRDIDVCAFHLVTMGPAASAHTAELFASHKYQEYLYMHGLSVEGAEGLAEYWHKVVRGELGIAGKDAADTRRLFSQGYQGSRYSFGYPACPNLEDQQKLFVLLNPERIGVTLSDEYQLEPEQSTSAIIVHHPEARYFFIT